MARAQSYVGVVYGVGTVPTSVAVSNSVLKVFGASSWASDTATANSPYDRWITLTNCEAIGGVDVYVDLVAAGVARSGKVSSTDFMWVVNADSSKDIFVPAGYELVVVKAATSTTKVKAFELMP